MYQSELPFERWALIEDYPAYEVSEYGRVRRCRPDRCGRGVGRPMPWHQRASGHVYVALSRAGGGRTRPVHVLVARAFIGLCPPGHEVDHIDFNPANNHYTNLQYLTHADNQRRSFAAGRIVLSHHRGEKANGAKLTEDAVREIRRRYQGGGVHHRQLALEFGVSQVLISKIVRKESWAHVA
jgi:hypothetical protein